MTLSQQSRTNDIRATAQHLLTPGVRLMLARALLGLLAILTLGFYVVKVPPAFVKDWNQTGWTLTMADRGLLLAVLALPLVYCASAAVIFGRKPSEQLALCVSFTLLVFGAALTSYIVYDSSGALSRLPDWLRQVVIFVRVIGWVLLPILLLYFPSGRFVPGWTRWLAILWAAYCLSWLVIPSLDPHRQHDGFAIPLLALGCIVVGTAIQLFRYARRASPVERRQTRWSVVGFAVAALALVAMGVLVTLGAITENTVPRLWAYDTIIGMIIARFYLWLTDYGWPTMMFLWVIGLMLVPISIGVGILRYQQGDLEPLVAQTGEAHALHAR